MKGGYVGLSYYGGPTNAEFVRRDGRRAVGEKDEPRIMWITRKKAAMVWQPYTGNSFLFSFLFLFDYLDDCVVEQFGKGNGWMFLTIRQCYFANFFVLIY